jgi:hypothetical protein
MDLFDFLKDLKAKASPIGDFWRLEEHEIPASPGAYLLVARSSVRFTYPAGRSPIYYVGMAQSLRRRLSDHLKHHTEVRDRRDTSSFYEPRHEYGGVHGGRYCFIRAWRSMSARSLEDAVLARFFVQYHSFPVANRAGGWRRVEQEFKNV